MRSRKTLLHYSMKSFRKFTLVLVALAALPMLFWAQSADIPAPDAPAAVKEKPAPVAAPEAPPAPEALPALESAMLAAEEAVAQAEEGKAAAESLEPAAAPESEPEVAESGQAKKPEKVWHRRNEVVGIGQDVHIKADERVGEAIVIFGNLIVDGMVDNQVVVIGGRVKINGPVGEMVLVLSNGELGADASIKHDAVVVGGRLENPHSVKIGGSTVSIEQHFPQFGAGLDWFRQGLVLGRPVVPALRMTWIVAGAFLAFYLFIALILGRAVNSTAVTLETKPGGTLLAALLFLPGFPLFILLLLATGIGVLLVPFVMIALFFAALFGKVAFLAFVGRAVLRPAGANTMGIAVLATLIGGIIVTLLYGIWYLGFALWALTTWIGIGMVIMTLISALKRERPKPAAKTPIGPAPVPAGSAPTSTAPAATAPAVSSLTLPMSAAVASGIVGDAVDEASAGGVAGNAPESTVAPESAAAPEAPPPIPPVQATSSLVSSPISAVGYERANFGIRLAAILIDVILVGAVIGPLGGGGMFPIFLGLYCALLWFYRGTSVGGIICGLKIVRLDGRALDLPTAIVRTLGAFLSVICVGLGFLWVIWDPEKQTWHDKIAGTTVIRVPKGMSLV